MNCHDVARFLHPYLDGELDVARTLAIEEHLATCSRCRGREAAVQSVRAAVRRHTEYRPTPAPLRNQVLRMCAGRPRGGWGGRRLVLAATAAVVIAAVIGYTMPGTQPDNAGARGARVVFHIASSQNAEAALRTLGNHLDASPGVKVIVVAHNDGVDFLLRGARDAAGMPYETALRRFSDLGVEFRVCGNTLVRRKIDSNSVVPGAVLVPSGIAEISRLQSEEGYAYMRL